MMIKIKTWLAISLLSTVGLLGCAPAAQNNPNAKYSTTRTMNQNNYASNYTTQIPPNANANINDLGGTHPSSYQSNSLYKSGAMGVRSSNTRSYGFAKYHKTDMNIQQANTFYVDRNVLARAVSTVVTSIPGIEQSTVLVTDEDVFVGVPNVTDTSLLNKAKLSAYSISPRYYKIFVTGNKQTIEHIESLVANPNIKNFDHGQLDSLFKSKTNSMTGTTIPGHK
jgi:hypothetical protein